MNKNIVLSIMVGSALATSAVTSVAEGNAENSADKIDSKSPSSSGKCASGKCGTEKVYGQVNLSYDPQDHLVNARDGKCGLSGLGINNKEESPQKIANSKIVGGVCGK